MENDKHVSVSDDSKVAIPLRNLISILGAVAVSTWAYYGVIERLNSLESTVNSHWEEIEENDDWIAEFEPPKAVQDTVERVRQLELRLVKIETIINMGK